MSPVDFKKWPCRPVEFKVQGPLVSRSQDVTPRPQQRATCIFQQTERAARIITSRLMALEDRTDTRLVVPMTTVDVNTSWQAGVIGLSVVAPVVRCGTKKT